MLTRTLFLLLTPVLALACSRGGASPSVRPLPVVTQRVPCLTQPPPTVTPEMLTRLESGGFSVEEENAWLWTYVDVLERRVARDWKLCGQVTP